MPRTLDAVLPHQGLGNPPQPLTLSLARGPEQPAAPETEEALEPTVEREPAGHESATPVQQPATPTPAERAPTASPKYRALDQVGRDAVRESFWRDVVSPLVPTEELEKARTAEAMMRRLQGEAAGDYVERHREEMQQTLPAIPAVQIIAALRRENDRIAESKNYTGGEKRRLIDDNNSRIKAIAKAIVQTDRR